MRAGLFIVNFLFLVVFTSTMHAVTFYVPDDYPTIQAGINACNDGDTVVVRDGIYTGDGNRDIDFTGKAIMVMSENGPEVTIINCQDAGRGFYFHNGEDATSVVQGFTITKGRKNKGGGIRCDSSSPMITDCGFYDNEAGYSGGGMYNDNSNPTVANCTFNGNSGSYHGGGMDNDYSSPMVTNCMFSGNTSWDDGGGMYNSNSSPTVTNCTFSSNFSDYGGGMSNYGSSPAITNCTFSENLGFAYKGMYNNRSSPTITNCILWHNGSQGFQNVYGSNPTVTYSNVEGGYQGEGNIDVDPRFVSFYGFDYLLRPHSPCVDKGDPAIEDFIYDWHPHWPDWYPNHSRSDMGAYGGPGNVGWLQ